MSPQGSKKVMYWIDNNNNEICYINIFFCENVSLRVHVSNILTRACTLRISLNVEICKSPFGKVSNCSFVFLQHFWLLKTVPTSLQSALKRQSDRLEVEGCTVSKDEKPSICAIFSGSCAEVWVGFDIVEIWPLLVQKTWQKLQKVNTQSFGSPYKLCFTWEHFS